MVYLAGVDMSHERLKKLSQNIKQLIADTKKLFNDENNTSTQGITEMKSEAIALLDKALERINASKKQVAQTGDYAICKAKVDIHEHPIASLGLALILGAVVGAIIARKLLY